MRLLTCAILLSALVTSVAAADRPAESPTPGDIRLQLAVPKTTIEMGEPIPCKITVTNISNRRLGVCGQLLPIGDSCSIVVEATSGRSLQLRAPSGIPCPVGETKELSPGQSSISSDFVNRWAALTEVGKYIVAVRWMFVGQFVRDRSLTDSPPVTITIKPASAKTRKDRLSRTVAELGTAKTPGEKHLALLHLSFLLDPLAVPEIIKVGRNRNLQTEVGDALRLFPDSGVVGPAILQELREYGPYYALGYSLRDYEVRVEEADPLLRDWFRKGNPQQRADALLSSLVVRQYRTDASLKPLIDSGLQDSGAVVRVQALKALENAAYQTDSFGNVMQMAQNDPDQDVREHAVAALGLYKNDEAVPLLENLIFDRRQPMWYTAVQALEWIGSAAAQSALETGAHGNTDARGACKAALEKLRQRQGK